MKKGYFCLFICLCLLFSIGCGKNTSEEKSPNTSTTTTVPETPTIKRTDGVLTLSLGFSTNDSDPRAVASNRFKELVEKGTNGSIQINIYPEGILGGDSQLISGVVNGEVDMTVSSAGNFSRYAPKAGISALPYLFTDFQTAWDFMDSELMDEVAEELLEYNIHILGYFDNGFRCVTTSSEIGPINSVEDMNGLNIRTPENDTVMETVSALGANPKMLPFTELYQALKDGEFDAQENPIPVIYNSKLYEVQSYLAITNHSYDAMPFVIREDVWQEMTSEERVVVENAAKEAVSLNRQSVKEQTETYVTLLENAGMTITRPDLSAFQEKTSGVLDYFSSVYGEKLVEALSDLPAKASDSTPETPGD